MHDSLINRFRGAFLGTWLGESAALPHLHPPTWTLQALAATDRLGCDQGIQAQPPSVQTQFKLLPDLLPIALLYHDQPQQLQQMLRAAQAASGLEDGLDSSESAAVMGQIISLILRERFVASELIPQVIRDLDLPLQLPLVQELLQVQRWLSEPADLATVAQGLKAADSPDRLPDLLAVALYCFLSSPDNFQISLRRLQRLTYQAPDQAPDGALAGVILGAISGLYGGLLSLPMTGQHQNWQNEQQADLLDATWADANWDLSLFQRADWLLTRWSGASSGQWLQQPHVSLVAAPRVIQPRGTSSLRRG
jgi:hypothetical protein